MPAPALDDLADELAVLAVVFPGVREVRRLAARAEMRLELGEADAHRIRHAFADRDRLALTQAGQRRHQPRRIVGQHGADIAAVALVVHAQREDGAALRQDRLVELRRALRHEAERDAVFAPLLGDARDRADGGLEARALVARDVAMRLVANQQDRDRLVAVAPEREVEDEPESSDTTTLTISEGTAEMSRMVIGLPATGMRRMRARISLILSRTVSPSNMKA